ncbi:MAG: hypothetical protein AAFO07_02635 [Bacteroidota bacterium]
MKRTVLFFIACFFSMVLVYAQNNQVQMRPLVDNQTGQVSAYAPLPKSWKLGMKWEGPGGTEVEMRQGGSANAMQRPINSIDHLIQQYLLPHLKNAGAQIDNIIDLPGIARNNEKNYSMYWQAMPMQTSHQVKGIELTDPTDGTKGLLIVNLFLSSTQYGSMNSYYSNIMVAKQAQYEQDKRTLIYALENLQLDRQAVAMHNQREQQKSQQNWAMHNQRMQQKQNAFEASQKRQQTLSEINDMQFQAYQNRTQMMDRVHQKNVDVIWEQNTGINPHTGQQMNTSIHYKYNYVNQNGQVFGTNNPNYNPANDPRMNHMQWQKVKN